MADQWRVYRQDGELGPLNAREIREGLRNGSIDPFDLVSREGSNIRVDLVEVDEIFAIEDPATDTTTATITDALKGSTIVAEPPSAGIAYFHARPKALAPSPAQGQIHPPEKSPPPIRPKGASEAQRNRGKELGTGRERGEKKYNLYDKKRGALGPLSASEIQALFFRGILDNGVRVQKLGTTRRIGIHQFIAAYAGKRLNEMAQERSGLALTRRPNDGLPSSSVTQEMSRWLKVRTVFRPSYVPVISLAAAGVVLGILFLIFREVQRIEPRDLARVADEPRRDVVARPRLVRRDSQEVLSAARRGDKPLVVAPPQTQPPPPAARENIDPFAAKVGGIVSLVNMSFSRESLDNCALKCRLAFSDAAGHKVTGVFFKGVYQDKLQSLGQRARITGNLKQEDGSYILYISSVE